MSKKNVSALHEHSQVSKPEDAHVEQKLLFYSFTVF